MDKGAPKINSSDGCRRRTKRVAETDDAIVPVPVVVKPIPVQVPLVAVPVEVRNVAVAAPIPPDQCTKYRQNHRSLIALGAESNSGPKSPLIFRTK